MRRAITILTVIAVVSLPGAVLAGMGGTVVPPGKISGPAVSATIEIDPTYNSTFKGKTGIRLTKGSLSSGAVFQHETADGWVLGCDGVHGAQPGSELQSPLDPTASAEQRFVVTSPFLSSWIPDGVLFPLFAALGITIDTNPFTGKVDPITTDVENGACTGVDPGADGKPTRYILSFTATIQFFDHTK